MAKVLGSTKVTRNDPSINAFLHLEAVNEGWVTGSHYYPVSDSGTTYDNSATNIVIIIIIVMKTNY